MKFANNWPKAFVLTGQRAKQNPQKSPGSDYNKKKRPNIDNGPVDVTTQIYIHGIDDIDENNFSYELTMFFR